MMKIRFLGTAAAEGWPGVFCNCEKCKNAARLGGKDIRTRSQIIVNDDLLVDLPPDTYYHKLQFGIDLSAVRTLLVTHSHMDHFFPMELAMHGNGFGHNLTSPNLEIFCNEHVKESFDRQSEFEPFDKGILNSLSFNITEPFKHFFTAGGYEIFTLKAQHAFGEKAVFYLIIKDGKSFMQCNDTGWIYEENFDFLKSLNIKIDLISLDCTCGTREIGKVGTHMGAPDCVKMMDIMRNSNFTHKGTKFILTHFSHNNGMTHAELTEYFKPYDAIPAYDGMTVEI